MPNPYCWLTKSTGFDKMLRSVASPYCPQQFDFTMYAFKCFVCPIFLQVSKWMFNVNYYVFAFSIWSEVFSVTCL